MKKVYFLLFLFLIPGTIILKSQENGLNMKAWHMVPYWVPGGVDYPTWPDYDNFILNDVTSDYHQDYMKNIVPSYQLNSADSFPGGLTGKPKLDYNPNGTWMFQGLLIAMNGFLVPDATGEYQFRIASKAGSRFSLSSNEFSTNLQPLVGVYGDSYLWMNAQGDWHLPNYYGHYEPSTWEGQYDKYPSQQYGNATLTAGQPYAVKFEYKSYFGDDAHFTVQWKAPGDTAWKIIPNKNLYTKAVYLKTRLSTPVVTVSVKGNDVTVNWDAVDHAGYYKIWQDGVMIGTVSGTEKTIHNLNPGTYSFVVAAISNSSLYRDSDPSSIKYVLVEPYEKLTAPTVTSSVSGNDVTLEWSSVPNANTYRLLQGGTLVKNVTGTGTIIAGLDKGTYVFYVIADDSTGLHADSDPSSGVFVEITKKKKLISPVLEAEVSGNDVSLSWNSVQGAAKYLVKDHGIGSWTVSGTNFTLNDLDLGIYRFTITAMGDTSLYQESNESKTVQIYIEDEVKSRLASPNLAVEVVNYYVHLNWNQVKNAGGYQVWMNGEKFIELEDTLLYFQGFPGEDYVITIIAYGDTSLYFNSHPSNAEWVNFIIDEVAIEQDESITLYPNPANHLLHVKGAGKIELVTIYTIRGQKIAVLENPGESINVEKLDAGVYILLIKNGEKQVAREFIKQ